MTAGTPWSVKGIDPKAREIAKDLARRSGMTLGEWLNQVILEDETPVEEAPRYPTFGRHAPSTRIRYEDYSRPVEDAFRVSDTLGRLSARIEAAEQRSAGAIGGIEQAVANLMARLDGSERDRNAVGARIEGALDGLRAEQTRTAERLRKIEHGVAEARPGETLKALEGVLAKVASQVHDSQGRTSETFSGMRQELDGVHERLDAAFTESAARELVETVVSRMSTRIEQAERRTADALRDMEGAFAELEIRLKATETRLESGQEPRLEALAAALTDQMDAVRAEMAEAIRASATDGRFERMEQAVEEISGHVRAAEQRSAGAIEKMGRELLRMADTLTHSVQEAEQRSNQAIAQVSGEVARVADAVGAQALERLGGEITRITERLTERIANAERRSAQAIDDVGDQVARATERLQDRQERATTDLVERIRLSEERTARLLEGARGRIDQGLAKVQGLPVETALTAPQPGGALAHEAYADPAVAPFGDDTLAAPAPDLDDAAAHEVGRFTSPVEPEAEAGALAEDGEFVQPAHAEGEPQDYGAGLFAASEELAVEDDWSSPAPAEGNEDLEARETGVHELEARESDAFELQVHERPAAPEAASDDFHPAQPAAPMTTRELIEQARAAARAASSGQDAKARGKDTRAGSLFGGKKKRGGSVMRAALMVSGGAAAVGVALAGYVILSDKPRGALPERVAEALGVEAPQAAHSATGDVAPNPLAAVALAPKPIADQMAAADQQQANPPAANGAGGAELYNDAVRRIESKDKTGVTVLQKAANLGYAPAQFYLAKLYEDGQAGLPKDMVEARRWTERAAQGGDRKAMHNMALYFFEGVGGPKNLTSAAEWFHRAADLGLVDSQYNLARLYEEGFGVAQNPAEAYKWYLIAARSGDGESRMSALRIKSQLSAEAQNAAERAAEGFQPQTAQPAQTGAGGDASSLAVAQRALSKLGFYQGPFDGSVSPALKLAIAAYQRGQGLPATGQLDPALTQRLATVDQQQ